MLTEVTIFLLGGQLRCVTKQNSEPAYKIVGIYHIVTYTSTVILGDFNFQEIDWNTWRVSKNENHPAFHFIECIRDNFYISIQLRLQDPERDKTLVVLTSID